MRCSLLNPWGAHPLTSSQETLMKNIQKITALSCVLFLASTASFASGKLDWKACEKEVKEFKCSGDDKAVWACLEKHDEKLSKACQVTHEKGDKLFKK
jgi:hypothetical protein